MMDFPLLRLINCKPFQKAKMIRLIEQRGFQFIQQLLAVSFEPVTLPVRALTFECFIRCRFYIGADRCTCFAVLRSIIGKDGEV